MLEPDHKTKNIFSYCLKIAKFHETLFPWNGSVLVQGLQKTFLVSLQKHFTITFLSVKVNSA